ncbi:MAG: hypothetical protein A2X18_06700 [Bacteroidetes bacterium GWF2_40_14]|nr:MAG: hypothetical protein A2X18_06700 [Bacteroidetes bacterium GWF2_40_14]
MKKIRLLLATLLLVAGNVLSAQTLQVTGTVTDATDGSPVIGASVRIQGTTSGTVTNLDGKYSIAATRGAILEFSFIGMKTELVTVGNFSVINVKLQQDAMLLEDVLVVAYGTVKRSSYTGSAAVVKKEQIEKIQSTNLTKSLAGAVAGVQVVGGSGQPGSSASIRIRGIGSVYSSSAPLYVVDGAAYDGDINAIGTDDIESISVLKDAAAAALYGSRGANGVIMVTTKKGKVGKTSVTAKVNIGATSRSVPEYDRVGPQKYYEYMWEGWKNARVIAGGMTDAAARAQASGATSSGIVAKLGYYNPFNVAADQVVGIDGKLNASAKLLYQDDWIDALSQAGLRQDYNVSVNGGSDNTTYFSSFGYIKEKGYVKWSDYDRFTGRVSMVSKVNKWFKIEAGLSGYSANQSGFLAEGTYTTNPFYYGRMMGPIYPIYQRDAEGKIINMSDGSPAYDMGGGSSVYKWAGHTRPYAPNSNLIVTLPLDNRSNTRNQLSARVSGEFTFLKDFTLKISGSTDISNIYKTTYQNNQFGDAEGVSGRSTKDYLKTNSYTFNQVLTYNKTFGEHNINILAGHENYQLRDNNLWATRTGFKILSNELIAGSVAEGSASTNNIYTQEGYFGQASYSLQNKYFLSASYRYDGTSRFASQSRWGGFWSLGASWRLKQESFLADINFVDDLKFKFSYGQQGNDDIRNTDGTVNYYGYQSLYSIDDRNNGNYNGSLYAQLPNPDLKWEKNANLNVGIEFSLWNRLRGQVEYFQRQSSNLLFQVPLPQSTGISTKWANIGTMKNNGFEITLSGDIVKANKFKWTLDINATGYKNEITKMPLDPAGKPQEIISGTKKLSVGHSVYDFWLRDYAGVDATDGSALYYKDIKDTDGNVTGKETTKDQNAASYYYKGSSIPDLYGGITNTIRAYGFDLSLFVTFQLGGKIYDTNYAALMHPGAFGSAMHVDIADRWTPENTKTNVPRLQNAYTAATAASSRWLVSASYLSFRNVTLGYTIPAKLLKKLDIASVRIYATGDNLALFAARKGLDPQQTFNGTADHTYIPSKIVSLGLNITF